MVGERLGLKVQVGGGSARGRERQSRDRGVGGVGTRVIGGGWGEIEEECLRGGVTPEQHCPYAQSEDDSNTPQPNHETAQTSGRRGRHDPISPGFARSGAANRGHY